MENYDRFVVQGAHVAASSVEVALVPAILSTFMQSVQDEDFYISFNAMQGLAAMVDGFGKDILRGLVGEYAKTLMMFLTVYGFWRGTIVTFRKPISSHSANNRHWRISRSRQKPNHRLP